MAAILLVHLMAFVKSQRQWIPPVVFEMARKIIAWLMGEAGVKKM